MRLIDADELNIYEATHQELIMAIEEAPTVEVVPRSYADQIRWERDIAIEQLNEIGCQLGQNMDEVKKKIEPPKGEWISLEPEIGLFECSECGHRILRAECNFCPHCGCDMRKKV